MHIAVIMDGNGRWAARRNLPRMAGHRAGAKAVDAIVQTAVERGIDMLTLYAFSSDNWNRPRAEVGALFALLHRYLLSQTQRCLAHSIRINVIGRRERLQPGLRDAIEFSERTTEHCSKMCLRIAVDYSSQRSLIDASRGMPDATIDRVRFMQRLAEVDHCVVPACEVDLLIRTGGEKRLSDFLLWECAYTELYFTDCQWPDFDQQAFDEALEEYKRRDRRFGRIGETSVARSNHG